MTFPTRSTNRLFGVAVAAFFVLGLTPATPAGPDLDPSSVVALSSDGGSATSVETFVPSTAVVTSEVSSESESAVAWVADDGAAVTPEGDWWPKWVSPYFGCWINCWDLWFDCPCYVWQP